MANDDLNSFPKPPSFSNDTQNPPKELFEETPDVLPSTPESFSSAIPPLITPPSKPKEPTPEPQKPIIPPAPQLATLPAAANKAPTSSILTLILLILAGVGISASIFMYSQSAVLKKQLADISKTLEQQKTIITPTPTPTIIEIPTPTPTAIITPTPSATPTASITPTPTASVSGTTKLIALGLAPQALKIGLNHEPNAQLLLIKIENAEDSDKYLIKYFFRKDLTTKKYFYVTIDSKNESEIKTNSVYVNPDNNIPSLNDQVLGNKLGIDFPEAYKTVSDLCQKDFPSLNCKDLPATAQFIQSGSTNIWQITLNSGSQKLVYQLNSKTKEVLYKPSK